MDTVQYYETYFAYLFMFCFSIEILFVHGNAYEIFITINIMNNTVYNNSDTANSSLYQFTI